MKSKAVLISALVICGASHGAESAWLQYATATDGSVFSWSPSRTTRSDPFSIVTTWTKETVGKAGRPKTSKVPAHAYSINRIELDCVRREFRYVQRVLYDKTDTPVDSIEMRGEPFAQPVPDSVGVRFLDVVCAAVG